MAYEGDCMALGAHTIAIHRPGTTGRRVVRSLTACDVCTCVRNTSLDTVIVTCPPGTSLNSPVPADIVNGFRNLAIANLSGLGSGVFSQLSGLTFLYIGGSVSLLPANAFLGLANLQTLMLDGLGVRHIDALAFNGLAALSHLDLSNNLITSLEPNTMRNLTSLTFTSFSGNLLTSVTGMFTSNPLQRLDLSRNRLSLLTPDSLVNITTLQTLNLANNNITLLQRGSLSSVFAESLPQNFWYFPQLSSPFQAPNLKPSLTLAGNPLQSLHESVLGALPSSIFVNLTDGTSNITLSTCCGLEWLRLYTAQLVWAPASIFCTDNGVTTAIEALPAGILCPCLNESLPNIGNSTDNILNCNATPAVRFQSESLTNDGVCQTYCPPGYRIENVYNSIGHVSTQMCTFRTTENPLGVFQIQLQESRCQLCSDPNCLSCPGSQRECIKCNSTYFLFASSCVASCPIGFFSTRGVCTSCGLQCDQCNSTMPGVCSQCSPGHGLSSDSQHCYPCQRSDCSNCNSDFQTCSICRSPFFLFDGGCVASCPDGLVPSQSACVPAPASSSLTRGQVAGIIVGVLLAVAIAAACFFLYCRRRAVLESELTMRLLQTQEEVTLLQQAWTIDWSELTIGNPIGKGAHGVVLSAVWSSLPVAVKKLSPASAPAPKDSSFNSEVSFMRTLRHPNIVIFFGAGTAADGAPFLVTERMGFSLTGVLQQHPDLDWDTKYRFAYHAAVGMMYLHGLNRCHRDLKSSNLLVSSDMHVVKVADFGTSKFMHGAASKSPDISTRLDMTQTQGVGTPLWMAPEILAGEAYDLRCDIYSYGIVLWEIATHDIPWRHLADTLRTLEDLRTHVLANKRPPLSMHVPDAYRALVVCCWDADPARRPPFSSVVLSKIFRAASTLP